MYWKGLTTRGALIRRLWWPDLRHVLFVLFSVGVGRCAGQRRPLFPYPASAVRDANAFLMASLFSKTDEHAVLRQNRKRSTISGFALRPVSVLLPRPTTKPQTLQKQKPWSSLTRVFYRSADFRFSGSATCCEFRRLSRLWRPFWPGLRGRTAGGHASVFGLRRHRLSKCGHDPRCSSRDCCRRPSSDSECSRDNGTLRKSWMTTAASDCWPVPESVCGIPGWLRKHR